MWCLKEVNLSIRPSIEFFVDASGSRGSGQPRTPPLSIVPWAATEEVVIPEARRMVEFEERDVENIVKPKCGEKR